MGEQGSFLDDIAFERALKSGLIRSLSLHAICGTGEICVECGWSLGNNLHTVDLLSGERRASGDFSRGVSCKVPFWPYTKNEVMGEESRSWENNEEVNTIAQATDMGV